jgi:pimeloyl-ACP methyl ester carboxylesterase
MNLVIDDASFEYVRNSCGEPLVMVHGSASDYRTWHSQQDAFARHFTTISYSRRYHWPNEPIPEETDYSMHQHVDDLLALLHSLDAIPAHLVGHSYGAFLCLLLAIKEPQIIRTLLLSEPPVVTLVVSNTPKPMEIMKLLVTRPRTAAAILKFGMWDEAAAKKAFRQDDLRKGIKKVVEAVFGPGGYERLSASRKPRCKTTS